jgi:hypothetical protein
VQYLNNHPADPQRKKMMPCVLNWWKLPPIIGSSGKPGTPSFVSKESEVMKFQWRHISATNLPSEEHTLKNKRLLPLHRPPARST